MKSAFITWMVAAPENNSQIAEIKKYNGVGGHLFAVAAQKSEDYGFGCAIISDIHFRGSGRKDKRGI